MQRYANLGRNSGVRAFQTGSNLIDVQFSDGSVYRYTYASTGSGNIEHMKMLALAGRGLNSFISRYVKKNYAARLR
jgi:hypothetical protein